MARPAAIVFLSVLASPAFAAGGELEGATWWIFAATCAIAAFLAVGLGFVLQGILRLRNALVGLTILFAGFLAWLASDYSVAKTLHSLPELALILALSSPFFGLGWFIGMKDAGRRSNHTAALNAGNNHG